MPTQSQKGACAAVCGFVVALVIIGLVVSYVKCSKCGKMGCDCAPSLQSQMKMARKKGGYAMGMASMMAGSGGGLASPSLTVQPYGGQPPAFKMAEVNVPGNALYSGYGGVNMNDLVAPADNQIGPYHLFDDAYSGLTLRQLAVQPTNYKTIVDNSPVLEYGVIRPAATDSLFSYFGPAQPIDNNPNRLIGVL